MTVLEDGRRQIWSEVELVKVWDAKSCIRSVRHVAGTIFNPISNHTLPFSRHLPSKRTRHEQHVQNAIPTR
jgi:hypothetical protein